LDLLVLKI